MLTWPALGQAEASSFFRVSYPSTGAQALEPYPAALPGLKQPAGSEVE